MPPPSRRANAFEQDDLGRSATDARMLHGAVLYLRPGRDPQRVQRMHCYAATAAEQCIIESSIDSAGNGLLSNREEGGGRSSASVPAGASSEEGQPPEKRRRTRAVRIKRFIPK